MPKPAKRGRGRPPKGAPLPWKCETCRDSQLITVPDEDPEFFIYMPCPDCAPCTECGGDGESYDHVLEKMAPCPYCQPVDDEEGCVSP